MTKYTTVKCPYGICDGHGLAFYPHSYIVNGIETKDIAAKPCKCMDDIKQEKRLQFAKIPSEFEKLTVDSFDVNLYSTDSNRSIATKAKKIIAGYVRSFDEMQELGKGLFLHSAKRGSGKTRLAVSCANALIKKYRQRVRYITTLDLLSRIKETFKDDTKITEYQLVNEFNEIPVLILDDIGTEKTTPWVTEIFFKILDSRMTHKKVTIITSNLNIEQLDHDERIKSRLRKMVIRIQMPEEDIRGKLGASENEELINKLLK